MVTNKAILGFFVILILVILSIVLVRRNPNFMARFRNPKNTTSNEQVFPTQTPTTSENGSVGGAQAPSGLSACTAELKAKCDAQESAVCGLEKVVVGGAESTRSLTFKSACAYCSLYGTDDVLDLGDEKYFPLGYTPGACAVTK